MRPEPFTEETLIKYMAGKVDPKTAKRIAMERKIMGSPVQQWFAEMDAKMSGDPLDVDWGRLAENPEEAFNVPLLRAPVAEELSGQAAADRRSQTITAADGTWHAHIRRADGQTLLTIDVQGSRLLRPCPLAWYRVIDSQGSILGQCFVVIHELPSGAGIGEIDLDLAAPGLKYRWNNGIHMVDLVADVSNLRGHEEAIQQSLAAYAVAPPEEACVGRKVLEEVQELLRELERDDPSGCGEWLR